MIHRRTRVMRVPIVDHDGQLLAMLKENKKYLNEAHKFYRNRVRTASTIEDEDRKKEFTKKVRRLIYAYANKRLQLIPRSSFNQTAQNSIDAPINEFLKRKGNRKRPPRFRRLDTRLRDCDIRVDLNAGSPVAHIGFRGEFRKGPILKPYKILCSIRYKKRFEDMQQTNAYMTMKNGRIWLGITYVKIVECFPPKAILGIDAGMYSNKSAWIGQLINADGTATTPIVRIDSEVSPEDAAKQLIAVCKEHSAGISIENLKQLNRKRSGERFGLPTSKYSNALIRACEDNAIPLYQVNPRGTSSTHHKCYQPLERPKDERGWDFAICHTCNEELSADENAAMNIALLGLKERTYDVISINTRQDRI